MATSLSVEFDLNQIISLDKFQNRQNQTVFFTFTIIILTSDIGAQHLSSTMENPLAEADCLDGKLSKTTKDFIMKEVRRILYLKSNESVFFLMKRLNHFFHQNW